MFPKIRSPNGVVASQVLIIHNQISLLETAKSLSPGRNLKSMAHILPLAQGLNTQSDHTWATEFVERMMEFSTPDKQLLSCQELSLGYATMWSPVSHTWLKYKHSEYCLKIYLCQVSLISRAAGCTVLCLL